MIPFEKNDPSEAYRLRSIDWYYYFRVTQNFSILFIDLETTFWKKTPRWKTYSFVHL